MTTPREPLAARMRPTTLDEVAGQQHLLAPGAPLRAAIEGGRIGSLLFWGPPGTGKTTIARLVARHTAKTFVPFSAVTDGVARVREIVAEAQARLATGRGTILFVDEIHRFNKGQQDAFLPHVEAGTVTLIGATTENPSFELNAALLSRLQVHVLRLLSADDVRVVLARALGDRERGLGGEAPGGVDFVLAPEALALVAEHAGGDARRGLTALEAVTAEAGGRGVAEVSAEDAARALAVRLPVYDKAGEQHYDLISAFIKAMRGSDPQGTLYWLARMVQGGEEPRYIARRMVRFASEDVGLADPRALSMAVAASEAYRQLGSPEGELALAECAVYLATAPKSNRVYVAWGKALELAGRTAEVEVPMQLRNAPTVMMKGLGYGAGYENPHELPVEEQWKDGMPGALAGSELYAPGAVGYEREVGRRVRWWARKGGLDVDGRPSTPVT